MTRTIYEVGKLKVKMDTRDGTYFDAKDPHVYFERNGKTVLKHCYLSDVDTLVATGDRAMQDAIRYLRQKKPDLIQEYLDNNR